MVLRIIAKLNRTVNLFKQILYPFRSGKNAKALFFAAGVCRELVPRAVLRKRLAQIDTITDPDILRRVDYYNKLPDTTCVVLPQKLRDQKFPRKGQTYYFDTREITRCFDPDLRWNFIPGDVTHIPDIPSIVKSRPVNGDNANAVLLKLNKVRHFIFVNDTIPFAQKSDIALFRGKVRNKPKRQDLFRKFFGNPMFDLGDTVNRSDDPDAWKTPKLTIAEQLRHKFILAIEGNDVASNLKWIMSSNSIAVMPRPEFETWFMEGALIPGEHYIEVRNDYADLEEKVRHYAAHHDDAQRIIANANAYARQFTDTRREYLISLCVMKKYFEKTGQM